MKHTKYEANVDKIASKTIYINVNLLEKGTYKVNIVHKNKILKSTEFIKK